MQYEVQSVDITADITCETGITAQISDAQPLNVTLGKAAEIDAHQAVTYIESGKKEVQTTVAAGIAEIETAKANLADKDLSNLSATGAAKFDAKQDVIGDLSTIRSGAAAGATAVQPSSLATVATSGSYADLTNKPTIPSAQVNSDWNAASGVAKILNKPSLATVATSGSYADLSNKPDLSSYAADNAVVHIAGTETITGAKIFTNAVYINRDSPVFYIKYNNVEKGTQYNENHSSEIVWLDKNNYTFGKVKYLYGSSKGSSIILQAWKSNAAADSAATGLNISYSANDAKNITPSSDNDTNLGVNSNRWKQLYAGTTTISTSDEREKQDIEAIPDSVLDAWAEVEFYRYKFKDAVAEKGSSARWHTGMIAQRIESVFAAHDLDAHKYGLLCYDEWEAQAAEYDENGDLVIPAREAGNRYALRYEECLTMEAAYQRRRADRIEARLDALEARL